VTLKIFVERDNQDKCQHAMEALKKSMQWDEKTYGREYDLDIYMIVAVNDFNMGAMENKGLNVFNSKYILARPESATDRDYQLIDAVVGHEYFHNWTGNRITCRDWFQLSLKEGLTVFREHQFSADITQSPVSLIENVRTLKNSQFTEDSGPLAHSVRPDSYVEINNFYTATIYEKGAELIRMLKTLIGSKAFRQGMDIYFEKYDGQAVTTDEFVLSMSEASGMDLSQFKLWYSQAGTPELSIEESFDPKQNLYRLTLSQFCPDTPSQTNKLPMLIPVAIGLLDPETGADLLLEKTQVLQLKEKRQVFEFKNLKQNSNGEPLIKSPILSILRGFSAPVKVKTTLSNQALAFLLKYDSDDFTRWDAGQQLVERLILQCYKERFSKNSKNKLSQETETLLQLWLDSMRALLQDEAVHPALKAELLSLPSLSYLIELQESVEVDALYSALQFVKHALVEACNPLLLHAYQSNLIKEFYAYTPEQTAKRYLKNTALRYLGPVSKEGLKLCQQQWQHAYNMTDSFAAVAAISDLDCPERTALLDAFYERWQHDTNVLDKWFRVQASSEIPNALAKVKHLCQHPAFSIKNPNKVYSLINAFVLTNVAFHVASGEGYQFLTDKVLELNVLNPQVAARLLKVFGNWKKLDKGRQEKIRTQLLRIKNAKGISKDVFEVADKSLG
jgi:aminopeptidase N